MRKPATTEELPKEVGTEPVVYAVDDSALDKSAEIKHRDHSTAQVQLGLTEVVAATVDGKDGLNGDVREDVTPDNRKIMLDFDQFCGAVRACEPRVSHKIEVLKVRFDKIDTGKSGRIELAEYLKAALRDTVARDKD